MTSDSFSGHVCASEAALQLNIFFPVHIHFLYWIEHSWTIDAAIRVANIQPTALKCTSESSA